MLNGYGMLNGWMVMEIIRHHELNINGDILFSEKKTFADT